jgi:hypothetical protein
MLRMYIYSVNMLMQYRTSSFMKYASHLKTLIKDYISIHELSSD